MTIALSDATMCYAGVVIGIGYALYTLRVLFRTIRDYNIHATQAGSRRVY